MPSSHPALEGCDGSWHTTRLQDPLLSQFWRLFELSPASKRRIWTAGHEAPLRCATQHQLRTSATLRTRHAPSRHTLAETIATHLHSGIPMRNKRTRRSRVTPGLTCERLEPRQLLDSSAARLSVSIPQATLPSTVTVLSTAATATAQDGPFTYFISNGSVTITRYSGASGVVQIPNQISGLPVRSLAAQILKDLNSIRSVRTINIPSSVTSIHENAFVQSRYLTAINVDGGNPAYASAGGILYNKGFSILLTAPSYVASPVIIPASVRVISFRAFSGCLGLSAIDIPVGVTDIATSAFAQCSNLKTVNLPSTLRKIGSSAFAGCSGLMSVTIPSSVTAVEGSTFENCNALKSVSIPNSATSIGPAAFRNCTSLESIRLPARLTRIEASGFENCVSLKTVVIPTNVTSIGVSAFKNCASLTSITLPRSLKNIEGSVLENCLSLTSVAIPASVTRIGAAAFSNTGITSMSIPSGVSSIGVQAFRNCASLVFLAVEGGNRTYASIDGILYNKTVSTLIQCPAGKSGSIQIPSTVLNIGTGAFEFCRNVTNVEIPGSVQNIGPSAFANASGLKTLSIPGSVRTIGDGAFRFCRGLMSFSVAPDNKNFASVDGILYDKSLSTLMQCPAKRVESVRVAASAVRLGSWAFESCVDLGVIYFDQGLVGDKDSSFVGCGATLHVLQRDAGINYTSAKQHCGRPVLLYQRFDIPKGFTVDVRDFNGGISRLTNLVVKSGEGTLVVPAVRQGEPITGAIVEQGELVIGSKHAVGTGVLEVKGGGRVTLRVGFDAVPISRLMLGVGSLLDVGTGQIKVWRGGFDEASIRQSLISGRKGGAWDGLTGIVSSAASEAAMRAVGYRVADDGTLVVGWAAHGDLNLDGIITQVERTVVFLNSISEGEARAAGVWYKGDFDYDGSVTSTDYQMLRKSITVSGTGSYRLGTGTIL
jgi:hypothetical protein